MLALVDLTSMLKRTIRLPELKGNKMINYCYGHGGEKCYPKVTLSWFCPEHSPFPLEAWCQALL